MMESPARGVVSVDAVLILGPAVMRAARWIGWCSLVFRKENAKSAIRFGTHPQQSRQAQCCDLPTNRDEDPTRHEAFDIVVGRARAWLDGGRVSVRSGHGGGGRAPGPYREGVAPSIATGLGRTGQRYESHSANQHHRGPPSGHLQHCGITSFAAKGMSPCANLPASLRPRERASAIMSQTAHTCAIRLTRATDPKRVPVA